ncbi:hypothetical protein GA0115255_111751, partial [Streptomyces sp. Ncost-T6T-2b]
VHHDLLRTSAVHRESELSASDAGHCAVRAACLASEA